MLPSRGGSSVGRPDQTAALVMIRKIFRRSTRPIPGFSPNVSLNKKHKRFDDAGRAIERALQHALDQIERNICHGPKFSKCEKSVVPRADTGAPVTAPLLAAMSYSPASASIESCRAIIELPSYGWSESSAMGICAPISTLSSCGCMTSSTTVREGAGAPILHLDLR